MTLPFLYLLAASCSSGDDDASADTASETASDTATPSGDTGSPPGEGETLVLTFVADPTDGIADHPQTGRRYEPLLDLAYDADGRRHWTLEDLDAAVDEADDWVADTVPAWTKGASLLFRDPAWAAYHTWPSIIDLTELERADAEVYGKVFDALLAFDPDAASVRSTYDARIAAGNRVYAARDYVGVVPGEDRSSFHEVHYAFLLDLDARDVIELQVHSRAAEGLQEVRDDAIEDLQGILDAPPKTDGEVWQLCLREDYRPGAYIAFVLDSLSDPEGAQQFYVERVHPTCAAPGGPPPDEPPDDDDDKEPPPDKPRRGGAGDGSSGKRGDNNEGAPLPPDRDQLGEDDDDPFRREEGRVEDVDDTAEGEGAGPAECPPNGEQEIDKAQQTIDQLQQSLDMIAATYTEDANLFRGMSYVFVTGQGFANPCVQALYEEYEPQIEAIDAEAADIREQLRARANAAQAEKQALGAEVRIAKDIDNFWSLMLEFGGSWHQIWAPIPPVLVPSGSGASSGLAGTDLVMFTDDMGTYIQRQMARKLMNGKSWDEAKAEVLDDPKAYGEEGIVDDPVWRFILNGYFAGLEELYRRMIPRFVEETFGETDDEEIDRIIALMFTRTPTAATKAACDTYEAELTKVWEGSEELITRLDELRRERRRLNEEFRARAVACFEAAVADYRLQLNMRLILEDFIELCQGLGDDTFPYSGTPEDLCAAICQLLAQVPENCPQLRNYLQNLLNANCGREGCGGIAAAR